MIHAVDAIREEYEKNVLSAVKLKRLPEKEKQKPTSDGIISYLIRVRGKLHHANLPASSSHWLPTHAERYSDEVDLIARIAKNVLDNKVAALTLS